MSLLISLEAEYASVVGLVMLDDVIPLLRIQKSVFSIQNKKPKDLIFGIVCILTPGVSHARSPVLLLLYSVPYQLIIKI